MMYVSVIVPAYNAAATIMQTLESLLAQRSPAWEAVVIDDGSTDDTAVIVNKVAAADARIRLISQPNGGVSVARNTGIREARYDWLLFLDADDWILPTYLERMTAVLADQPDLDVVHCGSTRVTPDGIWLETECAIDAPDMFDTFARMSAFPIHACIARRSLINEVGGFEVDMTMCEDWDLWQRVARAGARFGAVPDVLAFYRMRPQSASTDGVAMFQAALEVLRRGHGPDPRVPHPEPEHAAGLPTTYLVRRTFYQAVWFAGIVIGGGGDARPLLASLERENDPALEAETMAQFLFKSTLLPAGFVPTAWVAFWPEVANALAGFLAALEEHAGAVGLGQDVQANLERMIINEMREERPFTFNQTHAIQLEMKTPISEMTLPPGVTQLLCNILLERSAFKQIVITRSANDAVVTADTIATAIAADNAWDILGRFFAHNLFPQLRVERGSDSFSFWRGDLFLGELPVEEEASLWSDFHDQMGWHLFLQEIWGCPTWPKEHFYNKQKIQEKAPLHRHKGDVPFTIELGATLPNVATKAERLEVRLEVGGTTIIAVTLPVIKKKVLAHQMRVALTTAAGYSLCKAVVGVALVGYPLCNGRSLRARLVSIYKEAVVL